MKKLFALCGLMLPFVLLGCNEPAAPGAAPTPPEVDVTQPLRHQLIEWTEYPGRFEAVARVEVRARVTGYLQEKQFRDGQYVKKGDLLFVIDPRPFEYEMQRADAQYSLAQKAYKRAADLMRSKSISQEQFDQRQQELKVAEAALNEARLNLDFTRVTAPIDGKISDSFIDSGNLVSANSTVLTRIVSVDPIHFEFEGSQGDLLNALRLDRAGKRPSSDYSPNPIFIKLLDEKHYDHSGRMEFIDNVVDAGTGTVKARALVSNPQAIIYPGLFGRARLSSSGEYEALLLPEKAINTDQNRKYVYAVNANNQATRIYVEPGPVQDNGLVIIRSGLSGDERVVINGIQRIRAPQQPVTPNAVTLEWQETDTMPDINMVPSLEEIIAGGQRAAGESENNAAAAQ
ncbi:efflux RND transporter periplasmic adaptor subunit [Pseudomaricurvus sp. HS19]|uniref:efflux RND transporter periplasmic adaptor subunit n=1 Tax=Pseudomaricurvus sp. HS19 TaxID=2692626 RepID=UPI001929757C